jgi:CheY-like chemotaxis protein
MAHILVVDDDNLTRKLLDQMLEIDGHTCQLAADCAAVTKILRPSS